MKINPKPTIRVADMSLRIPIVQSFVSQSARSKYDAAIGAVSAKSKGCLHRTPGGLFRAVELLTYLRRYKIPQMAKSITRAIFITECAQVLQFYLTNSLSKLRSLQTQLAVDPLLLCSLDILRQKPEQMLGITAMYSPRLNANSSSQP